MPGHFGRSVKWCDALDCGLQENGGDGSIDIVVAVDQDGLALTDSLLDSCNSVVHAEQQMRGVEIGEFWMEECLCQRGRIDPASYQEMGDRGRTAEMD